MMSSDRQGFLYAIGAYLIWGLMPLYFRMLVFVPALEILVHRIIWSALFMLLLIAATRSFNRLQTILRKPRKILQLGVSAVLICANWLIYIWAVNNHHVLEASLGYFINPLVNIVLGILFLGERLRPLQWLAVALAVVGVLVQLWALGSLPLVALGLAFSFGFYGLLRKKIAVDSINGLLVETFWLLPAALLYILLVNRESVTHFVDGSLNVGLLLMGTGIFTSVPLLFFASAAARLKLSTLGFFQYMSPGIVFLIAVFVLGETMQPERWVTFAFIWMALLVFVVDSVRFSSGGSRRACKNRS